MSGKRRKVGRRNPRPAPPAPPAPPQTLHQMVNGLVRAARELGYSCTVEEGGGRTPYKPVLMVEFWQRKDRE